jgi:TolA-binding protein
MQPLHFSFLTTGMICVMLFVFISSTVALDNNPNVQDRFSSPTTGKILSPSTARPEPPTKMQPTTDQKFTTIFSKLAALEQTVTTLQNQVNVQAQFIAQLKQVISVNSSGTVTIQALGTLKLIAGGNLTLAGSTIDMNAPITGAHGILKADTMMTTTVIAQSYTPGAGNIW